MNLEEIIHTIIKYHSQYTYEKFRKISIEELLEKNIPLDSIEWITWCFTPEGEDYWYKTINNIIRNYDWKKIIQNIIYDKNFIDLTLLVPL